MAEYIKREAVFKQFDNGEADVVEIYPDGSVDYGFGASNIRDLVNSIPAADVVPVVRCKDCEHAERYERVDGTAGYYCGHPQNTFTYGERWDRVFKPGKEADDFCSYGERKDGADHMEGYND